LKESFNLLALAIVAATSLYLLTLGAGCFLRPETAKQFLGAFARTPRAHFLELGLRIIAGAALVRSAPTLAFTTGIELFGWILIATSLALAVVPWRFHQRFAAWAVPQATQQMPLIGAASIVGGLVLAAALLLPRAGG
jgi:hypothetical protein